MSVLDMPLGEFEAQPRVVEFRIDGIDEPLFLVPTIRAAKEVLDQKVVGRGQLWTTDEFRQALAAQFDKPTFKAVAEAKVVFGGSLNQVRGHK